MERKAVNTQKNGTRDTVQRQSHGVSSPNHPLQLLQRSVGNHAVQRLIRSPYLQAKLQVSTPDDPLEKEADRTADTVMRMSESGESTQVQRKAIASQITPIAQRQSDLSSEEDEIIPRKAKPRVPLAVREDDEDEKVSPKLESSATPIGNAPLQRKTEEQMSDDKEEEVQTKSSLIQRNCSHCEQEETAQRQIIQRVCSECEAEEKVQQKKGGEPTTTGASASQATSQTKNDSLASGIHALNGGGSPLPTNTRAFFEPRFGTDFGDVRVHTSGSAENTAKSIDARAFTVGQNIAFGAGQYSPESSQGKKLLAHELTHTIQQRPSNGPTSAAVKIQSNAFGSNLLQRHPNDPKPNASPSPTPAPGSGGIPPPSSLISSWMMGLSIGTFRSTRVLVQGPGNAPLAVPTGSHGTQGFWEELIKALKPRPCKFYLCQKYKVCKPPDPDPDPDKDDDFWKWWKWECRDTEVCWCGLHEVPASTSDAALLTLANATDPMRAVIGASEGVQYFLRTIIGDKAWPLALRILAKAPSTSVPSLDEATWYLADSAIKNGHYDVALGMVLTTLVSRGVINASLADWSYVARSDRGEGITLFNWTVDPVTHERRATAPVRVEIYSKGFADVGWLFSTVMHEYIHVLQVIAGGYKAEQFDDEGKQRPEFRARDELESYLWEVEHSLGTGVTNNATQMKEIGERLTTHFELLTPEMKAEYKPRYDAAQRRVLEVLAQRPGMSITDARRIVQESSQEIAELLRQRPGNETAIDAKIAAIRERRSAAMIQVAMVDNPAIQVVRTGEPGTYRVPTVDGEGRVRYVHGGIQVAWHMAEASTSAYTIGEAIGVGGKVAVSGTAIQGRIHPFPPDIDFDEHIHVVADTLIQAGEKAAKPIIDGILKISGGPTPGRTDLEFRHLITFPKKPAKLFRMSLSQARQPDAVAKLGKAIAELNGGNLTTYWRGILADGRLTEVTRVVFVTAARRDGMPLIEMGGSADLNLAFLEDPGELPSTPLARFGWEMCCEAVRRAKAGQWLKSAKRAYNYFSAIGDLTHMAKLEPVFLRDETRVEQFAVVIDAIKQALVTKDTMGPKQEGTRILSVDEAQRQVETVAVTVEAVLPNVAKELRRLSGQLRPRDAARNLKQDDILAQQFDLQTAEIRVWINTGVKNEVKDIVEKVVQPTCPDEDKCKKG